MRSGPLKLASTLLSLGLTAACGLYVTGHVKNSAAPLHPTVVKGSQSQGGGALSLSPSVKTGDVQPVTSTYAS